MPENEILSGGKSGLSKSRDQLIAGQVIDGKCHRKDTALTVKVKR